MTVKAASTHHGPILPHFHKKTQAGRERDKKKKGGTEIERKRGEGNGRKQPKWTEHLYPTPS